MKKGMRMCRVTRQMGRKGKKYRYELWISISFDAGRPITWAGNRGDPVSSWREYINESANVSRIQFEDFPRIRHARMHDLQLNQEEKELGARNAKYVSLPWYFFPFKFQFISLSCRYELIPFPCNKRTFSQNFNFLLKFY